MALRDNTGVRDSIDPILRGREALTEEQKNVLLEVLGPDNKQRFNLKNAEPPSRVTVLLILALVEHIERLEAMIGRMGAGLSDELRDRYRNRIQEGS